MPKLSNALSSALHYSRPFHIADGSGFRLADTDPADTRGLKSKRAARDLLRRGRQMLTKKQDVLYAQDRWALLLIFQAMDAAGKDSTIEHVMSGVNPQGCQVYSFKAPSAQELDHDYLWRTNVALPERGRIGIFNRSYYEEVLIVRVHPDLLQQQQLPPQLVGEQIWAERFEDIVDHERYLARNGIAIRKFFLHVSREEQCRRFLKRLREPEKRWKFSMRDLEQREHWDTYMHAYEEMIRHTASAHAPWYVVPADHKWFARVVVVAAILDALAGLDLQYPAVSARQRKELTAAQRRLRCP